METYVQKSIKHCLDMIVPFEISNQHEEDGQWQFYQFMVSIYRGMYQNPEDANVRITKGCALAMKCAAFAAYQTEPK